MRTAGAHCRAVVKMERAFAEALMTAQGANHVFRTITDGPAHCIVLNP